MLTGSNLLLSSAEAVPILQARRKDFVSLLHLLEMLQKPASECQSTAVVI